MDNIALYLSISTERVRQLLNEAISEIIALFESEKDEQHNVEITEESKLYYERLKNIITANKIHSNSSINSELLNDGLIFSDINDNKIELISKLFNLKICGKVITSYTDSLLLVDNSSDKKIIIETGNHLINFLNQAVLNQSEIDVIIGVRKKKKKAEINHIDRLCVVLPEIEIYENPKSKQFQLAFSALSNARDRAYRILHSKGQSMYIDDIVSEVNKKMIESGKSKIYTRHTIALHIDSRFRSKQKTGYWDLSEWDLNNDTIEDLVIKSLVELDKPSTYKEITEKIHQDRPNIKPNSIRSLVGMTCLKVEGGKFILPEWKNRFNEFTLEKKKLRLNFKELDKTLRFRNEIIEEVLKESTKKIASKTLVKKMLEKGTGHTRQRVYKILEDQTIFIKEKKVNGQLNISLVQNTSSERMDLDELNWIKVKKIITRELKDRFDDARQPAYSLSFADNLDLLKSLLDWQSSETLLNGLSERIIPSIEKYYKNPDRTDRLNILKQLVTSLDPVLKKILFCVNVTDYNWIKSNRKGLGDIIGKLNRLDPRNNRFQNNERSCSINRWGKEINLAYQNRNVDTHNAKEWSDTQINSIINSVIIIMIYSVFEYETELKNSI
jgi:Fe2+ or Zn2+ uptake regulation protein